MLWWGHRVGMKREMVGEVSRGQGVMALVTHARSLVLTLRATLGQWYFVLQFRWVTPAVAWRVAWRKGESKA